jgi:lipopolysaccharide transport system permease protein
MMTMVVSLTMFMSPVFYSLATLDARWQFWMRLNPLTLIIEQVRQVVLQGQWPAWEWLGIYAVLACVFAAAGAAFFQMTRNGFADVL